MPEGPPQSPKGEASLAKRILALFLGMRVGRTRSGEDVDDATSAAARQAAGDPELKDSFLEGAERTHWSKEGGLPPEDEDLINTETGE